MNLWSPIRAFLVAGLLTLANTSPGEIAPMFGLESRPLSQSYLQMPKTADGPLPEKLSQTGAFSNVATLSANQNLIPYNLNVPFWSDGAVKARWISLPNDSSGIGKIGYRPNGDWVFPQGTVFVKHFELATNDLYPAWKRRLETRLLVCDANGGVYGATYKWRPDNSDADLLTSNLTESIVITTATGTRAQTWYYPSRQDCVVCHTANAGLVLGVSARQINRDVIFPTGIKDNQLRTWNHIGMFDSILSAADLAGCPQLAQSGDSTRSLEDKARSYLDANCGYCHRPGGTIAHFDARYETPLPRQNLVRGEILIDEGVDGARAIAPNDIWRSLIFMRASALDGIKMPPLARNCVDVHGMALLRQWIASVPGPPVTPPPRISPAQGSYEKPIEVTLADDEPGVSIRYTLDGSLPTASDPLYEKPIKLAGPTIVRAKAFKPGFTRSITAQHVFVIGG